MTSVSGGQTENNKHTIKNYNKGTVIKMMLYKKDKDDAI